MTKPHYWLRKQQLDDVVKKVENEKLDPEVLSYLAKYLCVLVCGWLETSVHDIIYNHISIRATHRIANFAVSNLKRGRSLKKENLIELLEQFDQNWALFLKDDKDTELVDAICSIVGNRNSIAHGQRSDITFRAVKRYYIGIVEVVKIIEKQFS